jgi:hypothetical protein
VRKQFVWLLLALLFIFLSVALRGRTQGNITNPADFTIQDITVNPVSGALEIELHVDFGNDVSSYSISLYDSAGKVLRDATTFDQPKDSVLTTFSIPLELFHIAAGSQVEVRVVSTDQLGMTVEKSKTVVIEPYGLNFLLPTEAVSSASPTEAVSSASPTEAAPSASDQVPVSGSPNFLLIAVVVVGVLAFVLLMVLRLKRSARQTKKILPIAESPHQESQAGLQAESVSNPVSDASAHPKVFISYRRKPSAMLATLLARELADYKIDAFVDTRQSDGGGPFPTRLLTGIYNSDVFICLLADTTLDSEWVNREIQEAVSLNKVMIPLFQESYSAPAPPLSKPVEALLQSDGLHILDIRNIYIDQAIADLAKMISATYQHRNTNRL